MILLYIIVCATMSDKTYTRQDFDGVQKSFCEVFAIEYIAGDCRKSIKSGRNIERRCILSDLILSTKLCKLDRIFVNTVLDED